VFHVLSLCTGKCGTLWAAGAAPRATSLATDLTSPSGPTTGRRPALPCTQSHVPCRTAGHAARGSQVRLHACVPWVCVCVCISPSCMTGMIGSYRVVQFCLKTSCINNEWASLLPESQPAATTTQHVCTCVYNVRLLAHRCRGREDEQSSTVG
jgi:hypothetical protein